ncbi:pyruvate dehydrogenase [Companilactobacillus paralimentarius DSM 13238 = JCM 10415]|jgi:Pyruvate/2-oxoglutarate dehydrogenase complex, dehydrogenase (E1) component, eukaryotic type, beta subunit|uniref:Pyruvate dehydrogenase n=1 Tax=Companilactobacillus paralimentarius DSM 13238 = JCM 10415 TaxID=1122151 RepID=A0A0R1PQX5_9LACO|nr:alpha-ketoacid dehydrogenase subunit beta [Companilactobacillus paralimentarius]KAE9564037.1 2-oxoisovalerate dehydrogenase [Companilactobacillus paralimentarius]KRL32229.1 pyruvate dehydrogenase [Companilactobacillus paralimentarius DSM 13238 = JCM 10415]MDR4933767.1 alpha-ketoacid dehydrogenase subunit beta [Companilactobacillus paralimentarius]QFR70204.1 alpha-ketoacid dehydrogenase subunit beta [Companilactobacillus paralimentarius]
MAKKTYIQAITDALDIVLEDDPKTLIFGEDVGKNGGVFRTTQGLQEKYGENRVFDTPLAESGILGLATGLGLTGWRPIPEIQFMGFSLEAVDQIIGQEARMRFRFDGLKTAPVTIRTPYGGGTHTAEMHADNLENIFASTPGLRVVMPSNPYDAKGLLISSVENNDPVLFMENLKLYRSMKDDIPDGKYTVPLDKANVAREGNDITIVAYGAEVNEALKVADDLAKKNISVEVIDLRTVSPIDTDTIFKSIEKTHKVVIVQEAQKIAGVGAQVASAIAEDAVLSLDAPIGRVAAPNSVYPFALGEDIWIPRAKEIEEKVNEILNY